MTRETTLVVIEFGASWPRWLEPGKGGDLVVVAQHYEGEPTSLVTQVANRIARVEATGWHVGTAVIVANERIDASAFASRSVLARGLLARLSKSGGGELVLTLSDAASGRACQNLLGLAAALDTDAGRVGVKVALRIGHREPMLGLSSSEPAQPAAE
ncbi:MAG: hypothetical protein IPI67_30935 [Myxococcales bacterium]|nr:hypothetical protein [Myxococcales bacterium]